MARCGSWPFSFVALIVIKEIAERLDRSDRAIISPLFLLRCEDIDGERSEIVESPEFIKVRYVSIAERQCPFELHVGRGRHKKRVNIFVGLGAQWYNYEYISL